MAKRKSVTVTQVLDFMFGKSVNHDRESSEHGDQIHKDREAKLKQYQKVQDRYGKTR